MLVADGVRSRSRRGRSWCGSCHGGGFSPAADPPSSKHGTLQSNPASLPSAWQESANSCRLAGAGTPPPRGFMSQPSCHTPTPFFRPRENEETRASRSFSFREPGSHHQQRTILGMKAGPHGHPAQRTGRAHDLQELLSGPGLLAPSQYPLPPAPVVGTRGAGRRSWWPRI